MLLDWSKMKIMIKPGRTDFRKQINGLSVLVENELKINPFSNYLFIFCSTNRTRLKILYWDRNGFCLWLKRLEKDKFPWPKYPESKIILDMIQLLYEIEKQAREEELSHDKIYKLRQEKSKPITTRIKTWLDANESKYPPKADMGEAINYTLNLWDKLTVYLEDGRLPIDNNLVENAIRPFVIGRKNWLFSYSENGANSSAAIYSLIETAKSNGKDPYKYLKELFEKLPSAKTDEDYEKLLPYYTKNFLNRK